MDHGQRVSACSENDGDGVGLVAKLCLTLAIPWTLARQAPLSMGFSMQEYWRGLPFPPPGDLPDPGIKPVSSALAGGFFPTEPPGKPLSPLTHRLTQGWCSLYSVYDLYYYC